MKGPKQKIFVGDTAHSNFCGSCEVIVYNGIYDIHVRFPDGTVVKTGAIQIGKGQIKNPNHPRLYGRGYIGEGEYSSGTTGKLTKEYNTWSAMFTRCYGAGSELTTYAACEVVEEWYNFQVFAKWVNQQPGFGLKGWCLDKDLLIKGNKVYSPDTCCFIPQQLNNIFRGKRSGKSDPSLPRGVLQRHARFQATSSFNGKSEPLGTHDTKEAAFDAVKAYVENKVKYLAELHKNILPLKVYEVLLDFVYHPH